MATDGPAVSRSEVLDALSSVGPACTELWPLSQTADVCAETDLFVVISSDGQFRDLKAFCNTDFAAYRVMLEDGGLMEASAKDPSHVGQLAALSELIGSGEFEDCGYDSSRDSGSNEREDFLAAIDAGAAPCPDFELLSANLESCGGGGLSVLIHAEKGSQRRFRDLQLACEFFLAGYFVEFEQGMAEVYAEDEAHRSVVLALPERLGHGESNDCKKS